MGTETLPAEPVSHPGLPIQPAEQSKASHLVVLAACLSILFVALVLAPAGSELRIGQTELPGLCILRQTTGVTCPGCGLTRSVVAAVDGDWKASFAFHRLGPVFLLYLILQLIYRLAWISLPAFQTPISRAGRLIDWALIPLMVLLLLNWIPTLIETFGLRS